MNANSMHQFWYAIRITHKDGSWHYARAGICMGPLLWAPFRRHKAVEFKNGIEKDKGMRLKVVKVKFAELQEI